MKELQKSDIKQEVFDLYDAYAHKRLDRRQFMEKLSTYAVGGVTVAALMSFMMPNYKDTITVKQNDPRLKTEYINYESPKGGGTIKGLLSKPSDAKKKLPGIVVVHENRGLNPYIEDTARRAALDGFISLAPDALTPLGGYPGNDDAGRELQKKRELSEPEKKKILERREGAYLCWQKLNRPTREQMKHRIHLLGNTGITNQDIDILPWLLGNSFVDIRLMNEAAVTGDAFWGTIEEKLFENENASS